MVSLSLVEAHASLFLIAPLSVNLKHASPLSALCALSLCNFPFPCNLPPRQTSYSGPPTILKTVSLSLVETRASLPLITPLSVILKHALPLSLSLIGRSPLSVILKHARHLALSLTSEARLSLLNLKVIFKVRYKIPLVHAPKSSSSTPES
ncbi:hypothetical protein AMTRI_Chr11g96640 [Amborella trichopoda]